MSDSSPHQPVLYHEIILALQPQQGGFFVDGTLGAGGHAWGILNASGPQGQLLGLDLDPHAIDLSKQRLAIFGARVIVRQASYLTLLEQLSSLDWPPVQGIVLDLGVSSMQLDVPERGFSFRHSAPLDMRFDPAGQVQAADLVNNLSERELADLIFRYGEERYAFQIARAIVASRPVDSTTHLAEIISGVVTSMKRARKPAGLHPATRTFQALRIATNQELLTLESFLPVAMKALAPGGRLAIISFHSLEDRLVKQFFRQESRDCLCPPRQPVCTCGHRASLKEATLPGGLRQPIIPQEDEIAANPRARSARLRVAEKLSIALALQEKRPTIEGVGITLAKKMAGSLAHLEKTHTVKDSEAQH
jgi:16S rRNA (cytosine1402-N4)-methyltransferase